MIRKFFIYLQLVLCTLTTTGATAGEEPITLRLPRSVIVEAVAAVLPLPIDAQSKTIKGDITIIAIDNIAMSDDRIGCRLQMAGKNLNFLTEVAGHEIKLKVGTVNIDVDVKAELRFSPTEQILYLKPVVETLSAPPASEGPDIGQALTMLLNGREFPIDMRNIEPLAIRVGEKTIVIDSQIAAIGTSPEGMTLQLVPVVSTQ